MERTGNVGEGELRGEGGIASASGEALGRGGLGPLRKRLTETNTVIIVVVAIITIFVVRVKPLSLNRL